MSSSQEEQWSVLFGVGSLEFVPQAELPFIFQLQPDDSLAERIAILANHTQRGTWANSSKETHVSIPFVLRSPTSHHPAWRTLLIAHQELLMGLGEN